MNFNLRKPCANCPFRTDYEFYLPVARVYEILTSIVDGQQTFPCHKTVKYGKDDWGASVVNVGEKAEHCAGALILLESIDKPNQMMRIAERLGFYDRTKLEMAATVFKTAAAMRAAYQKLNRRSP